MIYNVILEGGDLTGKSTVAKELEKLVGRAETRHCVPKKQAHKSFCRRVREEWRLNQETGNFLIMDRFYGISDEVYKPEGNLKDALSTVANVPVLVVLLLHSGETLRHRYEIRGDEYLDLPEILAANLCYTKIAALSTDEFKNNTCVLSFYVSAETTAAELAEEIFSVMKQFDWRDGKWIKL